MELAIFTFGILTLFLLFKKSPKMPEWRVKEAEIYFNGSVGDDNPYEVGPRTHGLSLSVKDGKARFRKQSKQIL